MAHNRLGGLLARLAAAQLIVARGAGWFPIGVLAFGLGCGAADECDANAEACGSGAAGAGGNGSGGNGGARLYRYILLEDISSPPSEGVSIDAIELQSSGGSIFVADVWECAVTGGCARVLGSPTGCTGGTDAFAQFGGAGHHLTASFSGDAPEIREGDTLVVHKCDSGGSGLSFELSVGVESALNSTAGWTLVCMGQEGTTSCPVPALPLVD